MAVCKVSFENPISKHESILSYKSNNNLVKNCFTPYLCSFHRILKLGLADEEIFSNFTCRDALHSIAILYKSSLISMEWDTIYESLLDSKSFTVLLTADPIDIIKIYESNKQKNTENITKNQSQYQDIINKLTADIESDKDFISTEDTTKYSEYIDDFIISDDPEESDSHETASEGSQTATEDFKHKTLGFKTHLKNMLSNDLDLINKTASGDDKPSNWPLQRIDSHIIGACTFYVRYINNSKRIVHIVFLTVQKNWRGYGLGKYLVNFLKQKEITASYDSVIVHAEESAKEFFRNLDFFDDALLNSQWSELEDEFLNCKLMTYLPPSIKTSLPIDREISMKNYEKEIKKYNADMLSAHLTQFKIIMRMKADMKICHEKLEAQEETIQELMSVIRDLHKDKEKLIEKVKKLSKIDNNMRTSDAVPELKF